MNTETPTIELLVPCERISLDDQGRAVLERTIGQIVKTVPTTQDMALYVEAWGVPFTTPRIGARILSPTGEVLAEHAPEGIALDEEGVTLFAFPLAAVPLPVAGIYHAVLVHDGDELARRRFRVDLPVSTVTRTA